MLSFCLNSNLIMSEKQQGVSNNNAYHEYLTEIERGKDNLVIKYTTEAINSRLANFAGPINIVDIGSYNGAMLNGIYMRLPESLRKKVQLYGFDFEDEILGEGRRKHPHINFQHYDITKPTSNGTSFDLAILSNILHEVYSGHIRDHKAGTLAVQNALGNVVKMIKEGGYIVLMDGMKPTTGDQLVTLDITKDNIRRDLQIFSQNTYVTPISYRLTENGFIKITLEDLAIFLSKAKYMHRGFWDLESRQVYHYFTEEEFRTQMDIASLKIVDFLPQHFDNTIGIEMVEPQGIILPAKNTLIFAQKV